MADLSKYNGISFEVKGNGKFKVLLDTFDVRDRKYPSAGFSASFDSKIVRLPFTDFKAEGNRTVDKKEVRALIFEVAGEPGSHAMMQIDNVRFY